MTAQAQDQFEYNSESYCLAGINGEGLFEPKDFGLKPVWCCSACWRGFIATYGIFENQLVLRKLAITLSSRNNERVTGPPICDQVPQPPDSKLSIFDNFYFDIQLPMQFSGGLLIAKDFIEDLYVHMGFHKPWKYLTVVEFQFDAGVLLSTQDRSVEIAAIRDIEVEKYRRRDTRCETPAEMEQFVDDAFSRRYRF